MTSDGFDGSRRTRSPLRDEEIERLLSRFFQQEMPASLPARTLEAKGAAPVVRRPQNSWRQSTTAAGVAAALFAATWGISAPQPAREMSGEGTAAVRSGGSAPRRSLPRVAPDAVVERIEMDPEHGPVERRAEDRTVPVLSDDPEAGPRLESDFPELTIEIVPIPKKPAKPEGSSRPKGPESRSPGKGR